MTPPRIDLLDELKWRGLFHQCTDEAGLREHLADPTAHPRKIYIGFDPTAPSLTIGNLVPIMMLAHVKKAGHTPVVLMGGGTGLIGDPSGKSAERKLMTPESVGVNFTAHKEIFKTILERVPGPEFDIVNNLDWLAKIFYIDILRDVGKYFSVNMMMQKESIKSRLENREQGISYTEFSYMILQAYDFLKLCHDWADAAVGLDGPVTVQLGGSDQFGNIVAGIDLIRRHAAAAPARVAELAARTAGWAALGNANFASTMALASTGAAIPLDAIAFGLTAPLVTKADGGKFGKTETGAVWLTADRTSPYAYFQFWLNSADEDAANWVRIYTFLDRPTIEGLIERHAADPGARELQRTLAREATTILHGEAAAEQAENAGKALFSGEIADLDERTLREVLKDVPSSERDRAGLTGEGADPVALLKDCGLASSNREAREFIANGSVSVNGRKLGEGERLTEADLLHGSLTAIRRGKKNWRLVRWV